MKGHVVSTAHLTIMVLTPPGTTTISKTAHIQVLFHHDLSQKGILIHLNGFHNVYFEKSCKSILSTISLCTTFAKVDGT
jgi:hypothetical protein